MKLTHREVTNLLKYDRETGVFIHTGNGNKRVSGAIAGSVSGKGYIQISLKGVSYLAHRLAWFYVSGDWPSDQVDHINGNKKDNRISNLRLAKSAQNNRNVGLSKRNTSGFKGVYPSGNSGNFMAVITKSGKQKYLGVFPTAEDAAAAYDTAAERLHGPFAKTNKELGLI